MNREMLTIRLNDICYGMNTIEQEIFSKIYLSNSRDMLNIYNFGDRYFMAWHDIYDLFGILREERIIDE